jgi:hypothetical protein
MMNEIKATIYLTVELGKLMKIHYMRTGGLPGLNYARAYLYTTAGQNISKDEYPEALAAEVYENLVTLKHGGKEIW